MNRYLVINPNSSIKMTEDIKTTLGNIKAEAFDVDVILMENSPTVLESFTDYTNAGALVLDYIKKNKTVLDKYDGMLLACFGDPSLFALKEIVDIPVIGIAEASFSTALLLGYKFGIVAAASKAGAMMDSLVLSYGLSRRLASVECLNIHIGDFINDKQILENSFLQCGREAVKKGAEVIISGCAGMTILDEKVESALGVPVIDPVKAGIFMLDGIVRGGFGVSRYGLYA